MSWQLLVGISVVLYSVSVLLQRLLLKDEKSEPISFSIFFQVGVELTIAVLVLLIHGSIPLPDFSEISWSVLIMTVLYALANISIFKSLKATEASRFTVIFSSRTIFAVIATSVVFSETLTINQWFGALLIIIGVIIVSIKETKSKINKGDLLAMIAAVLFGLANTNDRFLVKFFDPYSYVIIGFLLPAILIGIIYPKKITGIKTYFKKDFIYKMILLCTLYGLSALAFFTALQITPNASLAFAMYAFSGVLTVVLAIILLKEKDYLSRKIVGAVLSLVGLLLTNK